MDLQGGLSVRAGGSPLVYARHSAERPSEVFLSHWEVCDTRGYSISVMLEHVSLQVQSTSPACTAVTVDHYSHAAVTTVTDSSGQRNGTALA